MTSAEANVRAWATLARIDVELADSELEGPARWARAVPRGAARRGGGRRARVLQLADLTDVYMTFFLPETVAGRVALGSEVRIVLDAAPNFVIPASVSFVASTAQFTPRRWRPPANGKAHVPRAREIPRSCCATANRSRPACPAWRGCALTRTPPGPSTRGEGSLANRSPQGRAVTARRHPAWRRQRYGATVALASPLEVPAACMVGLIGPDGVGKSSLLALIAGARIIQHGQVEVLGGDMASAATATPSCPRIATCRRAWARTSTPRCRWENLQFFGRLFGHDAAERRRRIDDLTRSTGLHAFLPRPAGKLSGGMKQKLGLCCALIHDPDLLILDEPTTGVDPLARAQFWDLIARIRTSARHERAGRHRLHGRSPAL